VKRPEFHNLPSAHIEMNRATSATRKRRKIGGWVGKICIFVSDFSVFWFLKCFRLTKYQTRDSALIWAKNLAKTDPESRSQLPGLDCRVSGITEAGPSWMENEAVGVAFLGVCQPSVISVSMLQFFLFWAELLKVNKW